MLQNVNHSAQMKKEYVKQLIAAVPIFITFLYCYSIMCVCVEVIFATTAQMTIIKRLLPQITSINTESEIDSSILKTLAKGSLFVSLILTLKHPHVVGVLILWHFFALQWH